MLKHLYRTQYLDDEIEMNYKQLSELLHLWIEYIYSNENESGTLQRYVFQNSLYKPHGFVI